MPFPSPKEIKSHFPLHAKEAAFIEASRSRIRSLMAGDDPRLAIVMGPCSLHDFESTLEYARLFKELAKSVASSCYLVMRAYVEKPRTLSGWKGMVYDPFLDGSNRMQIGLIWVRRLFLELTRLEIPLATEFLDPFTAPYFEDLVSWGFIGARTSASQPHRQLASSLPHPIGFKNSTEGALEPAISGILSARSPHTFLHLGEEGRVVQKSSRGNPHTHLVLRGSSLGSNYDAFSIKDALQKLQINTIRSRLAIDCSHGNCGKNPLKQKEAFHAVLEQIPRTPKIGALMLESHLKSGSQTLMDPPGELSFGVSVTDPCLDWSSSKELVVLASEVLSPTAMRRTHS